MRYVASIKHILRKIKKLVERGLYLFLIIIFRIFFRILPVRFGFVVTVFIQMINSQWSSPIVNIFAQKAIKKLINDNNYQFAYYILSYLFPLSTVTILMQIGAFRESINVLLPTEMFLFSVDAAVLMSRAYFELGEVEKSYEVLYIFSKEARNHCGIAQSLGLMQILNGNESDGLLYLIYAANGLDAGWCPHQNLAALYPKKYTRISTDSQAGNEGLLFDAYNFLGQRVMHVGMGYLAISLYANALEMQKKLKNRSVQLSEELKQWFESNQVQYENLHILSWEWVTQIGHLGLLSALFRMRMLGWWSGRAIILLPDRNFIANEIMVSLFKEEALLVSENFNISKKLYKELFSLQRFIGRSFNAWEFANGEVVSWFAAGAKMMKEWERVRSDVPLRDAFDAQYKNLIFLNEQVNKIKRQWGMKPEDWYVCLHLRDAGYYKEKEGFGQTHRNGSVESYLEAIRYITEKGGWVIKMGGKQSPAIPSMKRVIDYSRSNFRSEFLDIYLLRHARFFIGTTSGLTNIAINFDIPCALVNCITSDAQLWGRKVRFALKCIYTTEINFLSQRQLTSSPWRWRLFAAEALRRHGAVAVPNTSDEILETVKEVDSLVDESDFFYLKKFSDAEQLIKRWRASLPDLEYYGGALPSMYYLHKHQDFFLDKVLKPEKQISYSA